jgi:hypothetical protein
MSTGGLNRVSWKLAVQSNLEEIVQNQNGIKVLLSMVSSEAKHLPPHARELLNTPQRIITLTVKDEDQQEGEEGAEGDDTGGVPWQRCYQSAPAYVCHQSAPVPWKFCNA